MSHVDSLYENIAHFSVTDLATLQTDAEMVAYELAVCFGQPVRDVSMLISDARTSISLLEFDDVRQSTSETSPDDDHVYVCICRSCASLSLHGLQVARHVDRPPSTGITAPVT